MAAALRLILTACAAALAACAPREWLLPKIGIEPPELHDFPADFERPISSETNRPMPGFGGGGGGVQRTPVIFVHGNTVSARYWLPVREYFLKAGYTPDELWALGYGWDNPRYLDSVDVSVPSIERMVTGVMAYLSKKAGRPIRQVDVIGHSLGVCVPLQWMRQTNSWHKVRNFVGVAGCTHGTWVAWPDTRGPSRNASFELFPGSPWLGQLRRGGETPGATRYMTLYDGTGWYDVFFPHPLEHAPALEGAHNVAYNVERGTAYDHLELAREPGPLERILEFLRQAPEPLPQAEPPRLVRDGDVVRADAADGRVHCADGGDYPRRETPGRTEVRIGDVGLLTCFASSARTGLSSPMARFVATTPPRDAPLTLTATPAGGVFEHPQEVRLEASDPRAFIVYTLNGGMPDTGSPLYTGPVYVPSPVTLAALAVAPDGRRSEPLRLEFDISLELVEARHTLERQFDPERPVQYRGRRKLGR